jgi:competence protein ComEA
MKAILAGTLALVLGLPLLSSQAIAAPAQTTSRHGLIDINTASESDLESLRGIGPVMAKKIIQGRPYKSKDELARRNIIPKSAYAPIKDELIAHRI